MTEKKGSVLVVDDKGIVAKDIASKVKKLGYQVPATAATYKEAVEKAGKHQPDIILMDIKLKGKKDGIEAAEEIFNTHGIPSIFLTAYSDQDTLERAKRLLPYGYMIKPLDEKVLEVLLELAFHRLETERSLAETQTEYQTLLDAANDFIFLIDGDHRITYVNPAGAGAINKDIDKIVGAPVRTLFPGEYAQRQEQNIDSVFRTGESVYVERPYNIGGKEQWLSAKLVPVRDSSGNIINVLGISRDISDRVEAENDQKEKHELLNTVMDKYPEYLYVADTSTHEVLFANQKLRQLSGSEMVGGKCYKEFYGFDEPCEFCTNDMILKTRLPHVWEIFNEHLGRHLLLNDQIIQWPDGRDVRFETAIDITDQKKIGKILEASERKYRSFIEHSAYGFVLLDPNGQLTYINRAGQEIAGITEADLPMDISELMSEDDFRKAKENLGKIAGAEDMETTGVYTILRKDAEERIVEVQALPVFREDRLVGFHGTLHDVTQKVRYQEQLKEKSDFLDSVVQNTSDGIFVIDEDFRYKLINPAAGRIVGHDPESWIGQKARNYRHPDDVEESIGAIMKAMSGEPASCNVRVRNSKGKYKLLHIRYSPMHIGEGVNILGLVTDITEKKRSEDALKASEEKYRSLFELSPEAIFIMDREGQIMECNNSTANLMEMKLKDIIGRRFHELGLLDDAQIEVYGKMLQAMAQGKELDKGEVELTMKSGCSKWVETFPNIITKNGEFYGIQMMARDITDRKLAELEMRKRLMKFDLVNGNIYLIQESRANQSIEAFKELLMVGHSGILISRRPRKEFLDRIDYMFNHIKISETDKDNHVQPDHKTIHDLLTGIPRGEIVHIDCIGYLISRIGSKRTINLIQYLKDLAITRNLIVLLSVDPAALSDKDLRLIEKESRSIIPSKSLIRLSPKLLDTLSYIDNLNKEGILPSYSQIGDYFQLSKPTARARIRQLHELGTVKEIQKGRMKTLELTEKGKNYLVV